MNGGGDRTVTVSISSQLGEKLTVFELRSEDGATVQRSFSDLERLYEKLRPSSVDRPPKRKFLVSSEAKLAEKRKGWAETFVNHLMAVHHEKFVASD